MTKEKEKRNEEKEKEKRKKEKTRAICIMETLMRLQGQNIVQRGV